MSWRELVPEKIVDHPELLGVGAPIGETSDYQRIKALPTRIYTPEQIEALQDQYTEELSRHATAPCVCSIWGRKCVRRLNGNQAIALHELRQQRGIFAPIKVGGGKTLLNLLSPFVLDLDPIVLLLPAQLKEQLLEADYPFYAQHWRMPNIVGGRWYMRGAPRLHVISYSELSGAKKSDLLERIQPKAVIADEAHSLRDHNSARTRRFVRYMKQHPEVLFGCWSGTLTSKSIKDYEHLCWLALRKGSPMPHQWGELERWSACLDANAFASPPGVLRSFCHPGEEVREGYRRRLVSTPGVVAGGGADDVGASLVVRVREAPPIPKVIVDALRDVRGSWMRPDGEELVDALTVARVLKQLATGFYYKWVYPRGEPRELIREWFLRRQDWHRALRERLKHPAPHLDSPWNCVQAAIRAEKGYRGELPIWHCAEWEPWRDIRPSVEPSTETVWLDEFLARDAADWVHRETGIVWSGFKAFGEKTALLADVPYLGQGYGAPPTRITPVVASIQVYGTGKNMQLWSKNLLATSVGGNKAWEQVIGRTHRPGQQADEVLVERYEHTLELVDEFERAIIEAQYVQETTGQQQKLNLAAIVRHARP